MRPTLARRRRRPTDDRAARAPGRPPSGRSCERGSSTSTSSVMGGICGCCSRRRLAPAGRGLARTVAALAKLDRERIESHARTVAELSATRERLSGEQRRLAALRADGRRGRRGREPGRLGPRRRSSATSIADAISTRSSPANCRPPSRSCRPRCAIWRRERSGRRLRCCRSSRSAASWPWPVQGAVRRSTAPRPSPPRTSSEPSRDRDRGARGRDSPGRSRRNRRVCGHFCRIRKPGHRRPRVADLQPVRRSARRSASQRELASTAGQPIGTSARPPPGNHGLYFELRVDGQPVDPLQWLKKP